MQFRRYKTIILASLSIFILLMLSYLTVAQEATAEPTEEATAETTAEATAEATGEATAEATGEATAEATGEATADAAALATREPMPELSHEELVARGEYLSKIARCASCHTPLLEEYTAEELSTEQVVTLSLRGNDALDSENLYMAGGRAFSLGPEGTVFAGNLTSDEATGIGAWTDEELEMNLRLGLLPNGEVMARIMPYSSYANWSAVDMLSLITYLRTLPAIEHEVEEASYLRDLFEGDPAEAFAALQYPVTTPEDTIELGTYLVTDVLRCVGCHTPRDPETGRPNLDLYLAGGQPFEGAWGTVYGSNITPHATTGIGSWTDEQIANVFLEGQRIDGRSLILMPWQDYSNLSDSDMVVLIAFLRSVPEVENEIPLPAINEAFIEGSEE